MNALSIGIDTSCYTTSVACADSQGIVFDQRTMLSVPFGGRGLRQSDGVFLHVKQLPPLLEALFEKIDRTRVACVAVSAAPTGREGSYMPVFLPGAGTARALSASLGAELVLTDHQSGHLRAALWGNEDLLRADAFYAVHLSGGTTDLMRVTPRRPRGFLVEVLGVSTDLHAGQFVDRVGVALGLTFPAGKALEARASAFAGQAERLPFSVRGTDCSFSGAESAAQRLLVAGADGDMLASAVYDCLANTLAAMLKNAMRAGGDGPVLLCGGVASSLLLRARLSARLPGVLRFGESRLSVDNAVGAALLGTDGREGAPWS